MKKIFIMLSTSLLIGIGLSIWFSSIKGSDVQAIAADRMEQLHQVTESAKKAQCEYIGSIMAECYAGRGNSCRPLQEAENLYRYEFGADPHEDCLIRSEEVQQEYETLPAVPDDQLTEGDYELQKEDPLFFGDEGAVR